MPPCTHPGGAGVDTGGDVEYTDLTFNLAANRNGGSFQYRATDDTDTGALVTVTVATHSTDEGT